jgi:two-component system sensor histidine kinase BaeS
MHKSLWIKFLVLLFAVSAVGLSAAFVLREMMIRDFREFLEGQQEDRVYWVTSDLETSYETEGAWQEDALRRDAVWALMLGFEFRLLAADGAVVMSTGRALDSLSPRIKQRVRDMSALEAGGQTGDFLPYPLFLKGKELGTLEVRFLQPQRESVFIERSNMFLLAALAGLGGLATVLSIFFSGKLTRPLKKLASVAAAISEGDLTKRVDAPGRDELGRLATAFNGMAQTLQFQEALRKKLISNTAHELRTPLTAIQGELEGMVDGLIPVDREQLLSLHEEANRLGKMVEGMEELTKAQASALTLKKREFEVKPFLTNIVERMSRQHSGAGGVVSLESEEGLKVNADPDRLSEIVINLVSNALRAVEGGGTVTVAASRTDVDFILEVMDTGIGIKEEEQPLIFERFYKTSTGGLGLGLAIVRELVDAHGGSIGVQSAYGAGTLFTVRLPLEEIHNSS